MAPPHLIPQDGSRFDVQVFDSRLSNLASASERIDGASAQSPQDGQQIAAFYNLIQHHGYPTPLLDWTYSPFIGAYFAYKRTRANRKCRRKTVSAFLYLTNCNGARI